MAGPTVIVADGAADTAGAPSVWPSLITGAWPSFCGSPDCVSIPFSDALRNPGAFCGADVALLITAPGTLGTEARKALERLSDSPFPLLVLADPDQSLVYTLAQGSPTVPRDADAGSIASILWALTAREPALAVLRSDAATARRTQGGIRSEMDKLHDELQLAAKVQRECLPKQLPTAHGMDLGVFFRPCGYVSGDLYDAFKIDDTRVGFFLADAVGHGVPAALMTMVISRALPESVRNTDGTPASPSDALRRLNDALCEGKTAPHRFLTAVYGVFDSADQSVTIAGAGHPPPLLFSKDGGPDSVQEIETEGPLLGVFPGAAFTERRIHLQHGQTLVMFSDGFETAFPAPGSSPRTPTRTYRARFEDLASQRHASGIAAALEGLSDALDNQSGSLHQIDDLTVLALASSAAHEIALPASVDQAA